MSHIDGGLFWSTTATTSTTTTTITRQGQEWRQKWRQMWQWQQQLEWQQGLGKVSKQGQGLEMQMHLEPQVCSFYLFFILLMFTLQIYTDTLPLRWRKGEWAWAQNSHKKKTKMTTKKATRLGDEGRGLGGKGRDRDRGSRCRHVSSPRYIYIYIYSSNFFLQWNATWQWQQDFFNILY